MGVRLNHHTVTAATCPAGKKDVLIFDAEIQGFGLRVTSAGSKVFLAQYMSATGKRRLSLGRFGVVTADDARRKARAVLGAAADGRDPFKERQDMAQAQRAAFEKAAVDRRTVQYTVGRLIEGWRAAREGERKQSYLITAMGTMRRHFAPWLDRPADSITAIEAAQLLDRIKQASGTIAANRALAYLRAAYSWAVRRHLVIANPLRGTEALGRERSRDRVLSRSEVQAIWRAADTLAGSAGSFVRVLLLTLQRREEVAGMQWSELADDLTTWTIPKERAKNGRAHIVHLAEPVRAVLRQQTRIKEVPFVFPAKRAKAAGRDRHSLSGFSMIKRQMDLAIAKERAGIGAEPGQMPAWVLHDFRRSGVTSLAELGHAPHVCDALLNHVSGTIRGVAAVYQRAQFLKEREAALDAWARIITLLS